MRLFFEWDPLVALVNALAGHALYRGLIWSLVILLPTLFLGRFFCGWICPMGTLQHFVGNMPSEAKRGKQRIESNRYKRWQTGKYVVLIAGLVAACFGSAAHRLARSLQFAGAVLWPVDFCRPSTLPRALCFTPLEHSHIAAIKSDRRDAAFDSASTRCSICASRTTRKGWCWAFCLLRFSRPACA